MWNKDGFMGWAVALLPVSLVSICRSLRISFQSVYSLSSVYLQTPKVSS